MFISIVTPSYNQVQYIEETIRSVLSQDTPPIEYLIADGGSTDGTVDIIKKYEDKLAWWTSETDRGQTDAINKGFARAKGELLAWINSDDTYEPGAVAAAVKYLQEHPKVGMVVHSFRSLWPSITFANGCRPSGTGVDVKCLI